MINWLVARDEFAHDPQKGTKQKRLLLPQTFFSEFSPPRAFQLDSLDSATERTTQSITVTVPARLPVEVEDPSGWEPIHINGDLLQVPRAGRGLQVRGFPLAWCLLEHEDCARGLCFGKVLPGQAFCCHGSVGADGPFWIDVERHFHAVEVVLAVRAPAGGFDKLVVRAGPRAAAELQRPFFGDDNGADFAVTVTVSNGEVDMRYDQTPSPNSAITRLRRMLAFPEGWMTYTEREGVVAPFEAIRARLGADDDLDDLALCSTCGASPIDDACSACSWS